MESFVLHVRSVIVKQKVDTIKISQSLLNSLPFINCNASVFCSSLKKCGYSSFVLEDCSSLNEKSQMDSQSNCCSNDLNNKNCLCSNELYHQSLFILGQPYDNLRCPRLLIDKNQTTLLNENNKTEYTLPSIPSLDDLLYSITGRNTIYNEDDYIFGNKTFKKSSIFYENEYIYGITNLCPAKDGHVLLIPKRSVPFYSDMTILEMQAMSQAMDNVNKMMKDLYHTDSVTMCIQDGPLAGQTIRHVHCHIMPRICNDFIPNDKIYDALDLYDIQPQFLKNDFKPDSQRHKRTTEEMKIEADVYKTYLESHLTRN